jgi:hypothetical protein
MAHDKLRSDKECENCGDFVEKKYCPNCGQKNIETRQSFAHLIGHFAEDLTHYDSNFWKTLKHLLFRPGKLTIIYLEGKRQEYVPPVKLYIFVSFVAFLILGLLASSKIGRDEKEITTISIGGENINFTSSNPKDIDTITISGDRKIVNNKQLDSLRTLPDGGRITTIEYWQVRALLQAKEKKVTKEQTIEIFVHMLPKMLFIFMPFFGLLLWLFHSKKRWYFFDHAIFTLHNFSFLLLFLTILYVINRILGVFLTNDVVMWVILMLGIFMPLSIIYLFKAHKKMYGESTWISVLKSTIIFVISLFCLVILLQLGYMYTLINLH